MELLEFGERERAPAGAQTADATPADRCVLIDANGYVRPAPGSAAAALAVLAPLPEGGAVRLGVIDSLVRQSALAYPTTDDQRDEAAAVFRTAAASSGAPAPALLKLADGIASLGR